MKSYHMLLLDTAFQTYKNHEQAPKCLKEFEIMTTYKLQNF